MKLSLEEEIAVLQDTRGLPTGQRCMALGYPEITLKSLEERFAVHKIAEAQNRQEEARVYEEIGGRFGLTANQARDRFAIDFASGRITDKQREAALLQSMMSMVSDERRDSLAALMRADEEFLWNQIPDRTAAAILPTSILNWTQRQEAKRRAGAMASIQDRARAIGRSVEVRNPFIPPAALGASGSIAGITLKKVTGFVKTEALDDYMEEKIPQRVLDSIEVAREAGLKSFFVAYPCLKVDQVELRQADPVVYAELGKRWLEIDYWE